MHERRQLDIATQQRVDDEPRLIEMKVFDTEAGVLSHDATRAVGADQVASPHDALGVVAQIADGDGDVVVVLLERDDLVGEVHLDVRIAVDAVAQGPLEIRLVEHPTLTVDHIEAP